MVIYSPPGLEEEKRQTLAIDFDGVLHDDNKGWNDGTCYGDPIEGSLIALSALAQHFKIVIFSAKARSDRPLVNGKTGKQLIWDWLEKHKVEHLVDQVTSEKPRAFLYIDDRGWRFEDWKSTINFIKEKFNVDIK
jgi:ribonucleotide monophosphatase NagD (HAD superfamily)